MRRRIDVQYSERVQRAQIQEKKNVLVQCYSIFTSLRYTSIQTYILLLKEFSISIFVSSET